MDGKIKYGLIIVDKRTIKDNIITMDDVLHLFGFDEPIPENEICQLRADINAFPEQFGVEDTLEHIGVYMAPEWLIEAYNNGIIEEIK